jgi:hypothetical protein
MAAPRARCRVGSAHLGGYAEGKGSRPGVGSLDLNDIFIRDAVKGGHSELAYVANTLRA